ncbi:MAG TPA: PAS domain S-box protein [Chitinophagaceae bacterium]|nr:PAS domain S-box protein [Chitinophagaceae bacterium]
MTGTPSNKVISVGELWRFFNLSASFFCIAGMDGYFKHINPAFERLLGHSEEDLLTNGITEFIHPDDREMTSQQFQSLEHSLVVTFSCRFQTRYGDYKWLTWTATHPHKDGFIYATAQDCTETHEVQEQLVQERISKEKKILEATLYGQEMERIEIGKELHDNVNQMLSTVKLYHEMALSQPDNYTVFIKKATQILLSTIEEIRGLSKSLVAPGVSEVSLTDSINELIATISESKPIRISFRASRDNEDLPGKLKMALFRITQEQLSNILKHAEAKRVVIQILRNPKSIQLIIQDDGKGFNVSEKARGIGLKNIASRARCYDGIMKIDSRPEKGCIMTVLIPIEKVYEHIA